MRCLLVVGLLLPLAGSFAASAAELCDVREALIDTLRKTPKSEFPADGVLLRVSTPATADLKTWHFRTGVPFAVGALSADDRLELYRGDRRIPVQTEVLATWRPPDCEFGKAVKWLGVDFVDAVAKGESPEYRLKLAKARSGSRETSNEQYVTDGTLTSPATKFRITETESTITVENGRLRLAVK